MIVFIKGNLPMHAIVRSPATAAAVLALLLLIGTATVAAVDLAVQEASLTPSGQAYEINRGPTGTLYVSDSQAGEIWRIDPTTGGYTVYQGITPQDAKPDGDGNIWWTDGAEVFGRIDVQAGTKTTWAAGRLMRFNVRSYALDTWQLTGNHNPVGMAVDSSHNLWWADAPAGLRARRTEPGRTMPAVPTTIGSLNRLAPSANQLTTYALPAGSNPQWVTLAGSAVWYSENDPGTIGALDPALAHGTQTLVTLSNQMLSPSCVNVNASSPSSVSTRTGTLSFAQGAWSPLLNGNGWTIFQAPAGASPFGLANHVGTIWITDRGRQMLIKTTPGVCYPFDVQPNTNHANPVACDGDVDIADVETVAACFAQPISAICPAALDFNNSGMIDVADITLVAQAWGWGSGVGG